MYDEDYLEKILGEKYNIQNICEEPEEKIEEIPITEEIIQEDKEDFTDLYPEIYRLVKPMLQVVMDKNKEKKITEEILDIMAKEIYDTLVIDVTPKENNIFIDLIKIIILDTLQK